MGVNPSAVADAVALSATARLVRAACAQVDDVGDFVGRVSAPEWIGVAADAYRARAFAIGSRADAESLALRQAAAVLDRHAARLATGGDVGQADEDLRGELRRLSPGGAGGWRSAEGQPDPADDALRRSPRDGSATDIRRWWADLSEAEREAVLVAAPGLIGRLDGLSGTVRSTANRVALARDLVAGRWREQHGVLTDAERGALHNSEETEAALSDLQKRGLPSQLYLYDPDAFDGDGKVAIAAGELDDADHVGVLVPGLGNDAADIGTVAERAANLAEAAGALKPWGSDGGSGMDRVRRARQPGAVGR